eukprot:CAMPEP_0181186800 /NCGR_PEP_ID=MMETSP1096-20121128/10226_1 /TAXON_ID=156174 ORGANISM="Chrysochromulina ericina, Strain CCMP281" /NCGR_SAMPLE_ID=MMETSP1096 /ASSEMBLY_ACC=CAM_ASM_000453 /LENGTH=43 /DNA_ID= /DNA_START= /DNA_END= /DNA_ORIENTATION=
MVSTAGEHEARIEATEATNLRAQGAVGSCATCCGLAGPALRCV